MTQSNWHLVTKAMTSGTQIRSFNSGSTFDVELPVNLLKRSAEKTGRRHVVFRMTFRKNTFVPDVMDADLGSVSLAAGYGSIGGHSREFALAEYSSSKRLEGVISYVSREYAYRERPGIAYREMTDLVEELTKAYDLTEDQIFDIERFCMRSLEGRADYRTVWSEEKLETRKYSPVREYEMAAFQP